MKTKLHNLLFVGVICLAQIGFSTNTLNNECSSNPTNSYEFLPSDLYGFDYVFGSGSSADQTIEIISVLGLGHDCRVTASANYEVSTNGTDYFDALTFSHGLVLSSKNVHIRLKGSLPVGAYTGTIEVNDDWITREQTGYFSINIVNIEGEVSRRETTWDGSTWDNGTPDIETIVKLSGNYSTSSNSDISAWSLNIDAGKILTVDNNTFVKVKTNVVVDGQITVETQGAFVQMEDSGVFTLNTGGSSTVNKTTSKLVNWYDYTYWSSPVKNTTVSQAFANSGRKYWYNAQNFEDILMETDNGNTYVPGHDDIDDNGDDWTNLAEADVLEPGAGYAATQKSSGFVSGNTYNYIFDGPLNTGTITTPIYFNGDNGDSDWNFIGNPYPGAIDVDAFFAENGSVIAGAIYFWSHATLPDSENNGNEVYNFNSDDYAIINAGSGEIAGGKPITPNRYIPSGQGFFVQGLTTDDVVFKNSMRVADNTSNSQFFRTENQSNKLWLSLSSDNGAFNQVLIAYVDGATDGNDGLSYDTPRNLSTDAAAIIYTFIGTETDKLYAIQGKAENSLTIEEVIPIGFYSSIDEATLYTFTLSQFQGEFLNDNTVYIKDNYQNITHNLTDSDYIFTSSDGEFNDRFEVVFQENTLTVISEELENQLAIIALGNDQFKFKTSFSEPVKTVDIYNIQGRKIYTLEGFQDSITYSLPALSRAAYIAKLTLGDNVLITKKMMTGF